MKQLAVPMHVAARFYLSLRSRHRKISLSITTRIKRLDQRLCLCVAVTLSPLAKLLQLIFIFSRCPLLASSSRRNQADSDERRAILLPQNKLSLRPCALLRLPLPSKLHNAHLPSPFFPLCCLPRWVQFLHHLSVQCCCL